MGKYLKVVLFLVTQGIATACHSIWSYDEVLPDSNTWTIGCSTMGFMNPCAPLKGGLDNPECIKKLDKCIEARGRALCQGDYYKKFACTGSTRGYECKVSCKELQEIKIKNLEPEIKATPVDTLGKAKKCQAKGGIWVNDKCQIEVE